MFKLVTINDLIKRSSHAVCGATEREVVVPKGMAAARIAMIKRSGSHMFIGSGPAGPRSTKIWFIKRGPRLI